MSTLPIEHDEHDRIPHHVARSQLHERVADRAAHDRRVEERAAAAARPCAVRGAVEELPGAASSRCSTIGPSESAGKNVSALTIRMTPRSSSDEQRRRDREGARRLRRRPSSGEESGEREHRHHHREAADERGEPEHRVVVVGRARQPGERAAVVGRGRREGVEDLGEAVRAGVVESGQIRPG